MKNIINYTLLLTLVSAVISSCTNKSTIARVEDYGAFINTKFHKDQLQKNDVEIQFWNSKLKTDTGSYANMIEVGFNTLAHFKLTGNVNDLAIADSLFYRSLSKLNNKEASIYLTLTQNAITQHKFKEAEQFLLAAEKIGADPATINLLKFDVNMELGNYLAAELCLVRINNKEKNFDYLIRKAKFEDYKGNAEASIARMEQAYALLKYSNKKSTQIWVTTNLGDMYSHCGRIQDAYKMYVKSLQLDSANLYALKGIATICFAKDKNVEEAERIFKFILSTTDAPDLNLNLAEISEFKGDVKARDEYLNTFIGKIESNKKYGNMYNKYLIDIYLNDKLDIEKGLSIAENEMNNRKTPETYSWLAFANYKASKMDEATEIIKKNVLDKTFEPEALYIASVVLGKTNKVESNKLKQALRANAFELGPVKYNRLFKEI
jgi:lipopolysaccharide biosynthesis regulator YciM